MSDYDSDVLTWSEHQAALLRRVAAGEQLNERLDWSNIAEEIEDAGRSKLRSVEFAAHPGPAAHAQSRGMAAIPCCTIVAGGGTSVPPAGRPPLPDFDAATG